MKSFDVITFWNRYIKFWAKFWANVTINSNLLVSQSIYWQPSVHRLCRFCRNFVLKFRSLPFITLNNLIWLIRWHNSIFFSSVLVHTKFNDLMNFHHEQLYNEYYFYLLALRTISNANGFYSIFIAKHFNWTTSYGFLHEKHLAQLN